MRELRSELGVETGAGDDDEEHKPSDGCFKEDVGWMKIMAHLVDASFYQVIDGPSDMWYNFYQRPPEVVNW